MSTIKKSHIAFYGLWPGLHENARTLLRDYSCSLHSEKLGASNIDPDAEVIAVFIESPVTKEMMARFPQLKLIVAMSVGYDHIDLKAAKQRKIAVVNVPTYGENTVAEHTFALILGLTRKLFDSVKRVKEGIYDFHGLRGVDIKDKTLGVVGTGHIGSHVIRIATGFEMNVLAYDVKPDQELAKKLNFTYTSLNQLLKKSDIVTLHTPLFKNTYHLINKKNIKFMKQGSLLINTARGGLIEPEALLQALKTGPLAGAGLDVLEDEGLLQNFEEVMSCADNNCKLKTSLINNLIIDHPNTIITPHNAFNSVEALQRIVDVTVENIKSFFSGVISNQVK